MFKPARKKSLKGKEKVQFRLEFHATRVPLRGWDKLLVSLISLETGKVTAKTSKAPVKNGTCQWPEPVIESAFVSLDPNARDSKEQYKLVVSMGLSRLGILGEATLDLADYAQALSPSSLTLPLQNCNYGSILHVKVQRVIPRSPSSRVVEEKKELPVEEANTDKDDCMPPRYSSDSVDVPPTPGGSESRINSRDAMGDDLMSPSSSIDSFSSRHDAGNGFHDYMGISRSDSRKSNHSDYSRDISSESSLWTSEKLRELEAAEATIKDLRLEVTSWEHKGKKMEHDLEMLKVKLTEETRRNEDLERSVSKLKEERDNIKQDMGRSLSFGRGRGNAGHNQDWQEIEQELAYEKDLNANLNLQLRKTQESNAQLLLEIEDLEKMLDQSNVMKKQSDVDKTEQEELKKTVEKLKKELEELERDSQELTEENMNLISHLKQANDKVKQHENTVHQLEMQTSHEDKHSEDELEKLRELVDKMEEKLRDCEESYENKLSSSRTLIDDLNSSVLMLRSKNTRLEREVTNLDEQTSEMMKEIELLRSENDDHKNEILHLEEEKSQLRKEIESLKSESHGHEKEKQLIVLQQGQLKDLEEKLSKAKEECKTTSRRVEELEAMGRKLKAERNADVVELEKQLADSKQCALDIDVKHKDAQKLISTLKKEKNSLEKEISTLLNKKKEIEDKMSQLQSFNSVLQDNLQSEQSKCTEVSQKLESSEAKYLQLVEEMKALEQDYETHEKEMKEKILNLEKENRLCKTQIQDLEQQISSMDDEIVLIQSALSASESKCQNLKAQNDELSEKVKNAQEDIEWARENAKTLVNEIRELEHEIESGMMVQNQLRQTISEHENQITNIQNQVAKLSEKNIQLEKEVMDYEERCKDAMQENDALQKSMQELTNAQKREEASLQAIIEQQQERIEHILQSDNENKEKQALLEASVLRSRNSELEEKLRKSQDLLSQANKNVYNSEGREKQALSEVSLLRVEKAELEEKLRESEETLNQYKETVLKEEGKDKQVLSELMDLKDEKAELEELLSKSQELLKKTKKEASSIKENLDMKLNEALHKEQSLMRQLGAVTKEAEILKDENLRNEEKIRELKATCASIEQDRENISAQLSSEISKIMEDCKAYQHEKEEIEKSYIDLRNEKEKLQVTLSESVQEISVLQQRTISLEDATVNENKNEISKLKKHINEMKSKISGLETEKEELNKKVLSLEEELQRKSSTISSLEKKLKEKDQSNNGGSPVSLIARSLSRPNNRVGPMSNVPPTREVKEMTDLREKVKLLEAEIKKKAGELETSKQKLKDQGAQLSMKIEQLDLANQQLARERSNSNADQLLKEINNLQNQNASLSRRELDLLSKLSLQESMQNEMDNLREEKRLLEDALSKFSAAATGDNVLKRITSLEMELAEVLEANNMYKKQLQSAFAKQQNVHIAALENLGSVEQVIQDLADLKRKNSNLEEELKDMKERYFNMSLQFAEVEAEREELVMTIRTLKGTKKLLPFKSVNF